MSLDFSFFKKASLLLFLLATFSVFSFDPIQLKAEQKFIIAYLEARNKVISITTGKLGIRYSIYQKNGALVSDEITLQELLIAHPELGKTVSTGIAGNDARLLMIPNK